MLTRISPPQRPMTDENTLQECECAIDIAVRALVDQVITAGWPPEVAYEAVRRVAHRQAAAYEEDPDPADDPISARPPVKFSLAPF